MSMVNISLKTIMMQKSFLFLFSLLTTQSLFSQATLVKDIFPGTENGASQYRERYVAFNGKLYFPGNDGQHGEELWVSDGTAAGTVMVKDIFGGASGSQPDNLVVFNGKLYFSATDEGHGKEVWVTDGTEAGTQVYKDFEPGSFTSSVDYLAVANDLLFIRATQSGTLKLWSTNGPAANLLPLAEADYAFGSSKNAAAGANKVYFVGASNALWVSDGTLLGTKKLLDSPSFFASYSHMTVIGDKLYYGFGQDSYSTEPWVSNGTEAGTVQLAEMVPGEFDGGSPTYFIEYKNFVYFRGKNQLWRTDGTPAGTVLFEDGIEPFGNINFDGKEGLVFNNTLYFSAADNTNGEELWSTNGTVAGTALVKNINSGFLNSAPSLLVKGGDGNFYFNAYTGASDYALWKSNGTAAGTVKIADPYPGDNAENLWAIAPVGNTLFFATRSAANGVELWKVGITTDVQEVLTEAKIGVVSPNPASQYCRVALNQPSDNETVVRLFDAFGKMVLEQRMAPGQEYLDMPVAHLAKGHYALQLQGISGVQTMPLLLL